MNEEAAALERLMNRNGGAWGLRDYQREAVDAVMAEFRRTTTPALVTAATGAGKSWMIAGVALAARVASAKASPRVLVIQPSAELVRQNFAKLIETGVRASLCSASLGVTSIRQPIVYGTPRTLIPRIGEILGDIVAIVVDECEHDLSTTARIVAMIREANPHVRVVGFTATPYILGKGYVYAQDVDGSATPADQCDEPYFGRRVYDIGARMLIDRGCLTEPVVMPTGAEAYETSGLVVTRKDGRFSPQEVQKVYAGAGRKTALIVADAIARTAHMRAGLIFAASIEHAEEVAQSMPPGSFAAISSRTKKADRAAALARFKAGELRWLVNVDILTRGFDAPIADHVVLLRKTESAALLQQIIGRVLRIAEGKPRAYVLDYAGNIDAHFPDGRDIFDPMVKAHVGGDGERMTFHCEGCETLHESHIARAWEGAEFDRHGYVVDYTGERVLGVDSGLPIPAHTMRRCHGLIRRPGAPALEPCGHWFTSRPCEECGAENDIAARRCNACGAEIVDPNENLRLNAAARVDPAAWRVTRWTQLDIMLTMDRKGKRWHVVDARGCGEFWFPETPESQFQERLLRQFQARAPEHDAIRWRVSPRNSAYRDHGGWCVGVDCAACDGAGSVVYYEVSGPITGPCHACQGTGVVSEG